MSNSQNIYLAMFVILSYDTKMMSLVIFPCLVQFVTTFIIRPIYYTLLSESSILSKTDNRLIVGIIQMSNDTYQHKMIFSEKKNYATKEKRKMDYSQSTCKLTFLLSFTQTSE